jgi:hypothetical protein
VLTIPPGGTATASWDFGGGRGIEIGLHNVGSATCEFEGHILRPGKTAVIDVRDGTRAFMLAITSAQGTQIKLLAAWRPAPPAIYTRAKRREIERDPKTYTISAITEIPIWVLEEPMGRPTTANACNVQLQVTIGGQVQTVICGRGEAIQISTRAR